MNLEKLINPISSDMPSGKNLRDDVSPTSLYYEIKDERSQARAAERAYLKGEEGGEVEAIMHWEKVYDLAQKILMEHSKDLEICAWLIEASVRLHQFEGLNQALQLTKEFISRYWETLYPKALEDDEDKDKTKISALIGLNGEEAEGSLIAPINHVLMTKGRTVASFAFWQQKTNDPAVLSTFQTSVAETNSEFVHHLYETLCHSMESFNALVKVIDEKGGEKISETKTNSFNDRASALKTLLSIADYFARTEPHSPIPYVLRRAVRW